jgi:hypothetical protein
MKPKPTTMKNIDKLKFQLIPILMLFILDLSCTHIFAQDSIQNAENQKPDSPARRTEKLFVPGFLTTQFQYNDTKGSPNSFNFSPVGIVAFPLVKVTNRLFMDAGVQLLANPDGSSTASIGELVVYYKVNPYMQVFMGNFSPRFGVYLGILDDFTNRFGTGVPPVGMGHGLQNQNGIGLMGAFQAGYSKLAYQLYVANGPQMNTVDTSSSQGSGNTAGKISYNSLDNNKPRSVGWHVGFLPFSNSSLELVFSGEYAPNMGNASGTLTNVNSNAMALGLNYYHAFNSIMFRAIAEYNQIQVQNTNYTILDPTEVNRYSTYTFNNLQTGWFAGITLRDIGAEKTFIKNLELAGRLGAYNAPAQNTSNGTAPNGALWGANQLNQGTLTLTYWLTWCIPVNLEYDVLTQNGSPTQRILSTIVYFRF